MKYLPHSSCLAGGRVLVSGSTHQLALAAHQYGELKRRLRLAEPELDEDTLATPWRA